MVFYVCVISHVHMYTCTHVACTLSHYLHFSFFPVCFDSYHWFLSLCLGGGGTGDLAAWIPNTENKTKSCRVIAGSQKTEESAPVEPDSKSRPKTLSRKGGQNWTLHHVASPSLRPHDPSSLILNDNNGTSATSNQCQTARPFQMRNWKVFLAKKLKNRITQYAFPNCRIVVHLHNFTYIQKCDSAFCSNPIIPGFPLPFNLVNFVRPSGEVAGILTGRATLQWCGRPNAINHPHHQKLGRCAKTV